MSLWTLAELTELIDGLKCHMLENPGNVGAVSIAGRSIQYTDFEDLQKRIQWLEREKVKLQNSAAGYRSGPKVADFRCS